MSTGWPVHLEAGPVGLRPIRLRDVAAWRSVRARNVDWLRPWDATSPETPTAPAPSFASMVRHVSGEARAGRMLPFVVTYDGVLVGQCTVNNIIRGSLRSASIGYWIDQAYAGRGVMPTAVALAGDHVMAALGLHRLEICIRPENTASIRVVEKLGFREEGMRPRFLHIDGAWRDHRVYALTSEELPLGGLLARWQASRRPAQ